MGMDPQKNLKIVEKNRKNLVFLGILYKIFIFRGYTDLLAVAIHESGIFIHIFLFFKHFKVTLLAWIIPVMRIL